MKIAFAALSFLAAAQAVHPKNYGAILTGSSQVPPLVSTATGFATLLHDSAEGVVLWFLSIDNPDGLGIFGAAGAHIHCGAADANGGVVVALVAAGAMDNTTIVASGAFNDTDIVDPSCGATVLDLITSFEEGEAYVNIHSTENNGGEIRGQVMNNVLFWPLLSGANEVPPLETNAAGRVFFAVNPLTTTIQYEFDIQANPDMVDVFGGPGAHIHCASAGANGDVVVRLSAAGAVNELALTADDIVDVSCGSTIPELVASMLLGNAYVNVHSTENPSGEVRGNIGGTLALEVSLTGAQESPPVNSTASGSAVFSFKIVGGDSIQYLLTMDNPDALELVAGAGAHIHCAEPGQNGPVIAFLSPGILGGLTETTSAINGVLYLDDLVDTSCGATLAELTTAMISGRAYVNVHSTTNPSGELRGNIGASHLVAEVMLTGDQQSPAVMSTATGITTFAYDAANMAIYYVLDMSNPDMLGLLGVAGAHIHCGTPGTNGGVIVPLVPAVANTAVEIELTGTITESDIEAGLCADTLADLWTLMTDAMGGLYVNVHSTENGAGEIRGNLGIAAVNMTDAPTTSPVAMTMTDAPTTSPDAAIIDTAEPTTSPEAMATTDEPTTSPSGTSSIMSCWAVLPASILVWLMVALDAK
jgi:AMMECR1 domain-containing protein